MRADCHVCRSEGFGAFTRAHQRRHAVDHATLNVVARRLRAAHQRDFKAAWQLLAAVPGEVATMAHPRPVDLPAPCAKVFGSLQRAAAHRDPAGHGRPAATPTSSYRIHGVRGRGHEPDEVVADTRHGDVHALGWDRPVIADKHCGRLPGNRTTPIVVAIVAAAGVWIPDVVARHHLAAGTADTMETSCRWTSTPDDGASSSARAVA
jgi:thymidine phosphorylase